MTLRSLCSVRSGLSWIGAFVFLVQPVAAARDVTLFVASDTHYGLDMWGDNETENKAGIASMNNLPGTAYPGTKWGNVATPRGVAVTGDLTDSGTSTNWTGKYFGLHLRDGFRDDYPERGGTGEHLHYPVYEGYGNHDIHGDADGSVLDGIAARNNNRSTPVNVSSNGYHYSWDWDDVHFVQLNLYAGGPGTDAKDSLSFLQSDLASKVGSSGRPVVLFQHYGFDGFSVGWWNDTERQAEYDAIADYNIAAIFTGHLHASTPMMVMWNGIHTFISGKAKDKQFFAVRIVDDEMLVAGRDGDAWASSWTVPVGVVPEPNTCVLLAMALVMCIGYACWNRYQCKTLKRGHS